MRQETRTIMRAFIDGQKRSAKNTFTDGKSVWLFDHAIAHRAEDGSYYLTLAGWGSPTTRDRLNGLCELLIGARPYNQSKQAQYFDDIEIDSDETIIITPEVIRNYHGWDAVKVIAASHVLLRDISNADEKTEAA